MEATYENCTGGDNSFGFVESAPVSGNVGPKTVLLGLLKIAQASSLSLPAMWLVLKRN